MAGTVIEGPVVAGDAGRVGGRGAHHDLALRDAVRDVDAGDGRGGGQAVLEALKGEVPSGRGPANRAGRTGGEQVTNPGTQGHRKSPSRVGAHKTRGER